MTNINWHVPNSSQIAKCGHDDDGTLHVHFHSGGYYTYPNVPKETWEAMKSAPSIGGYLHTHIKGKFKHTKIT